VKEIIRPWWVWTLCARQTWTARRQRTSWREIGMWSWRWCSWCRCRACELSWRRGGCWSCSSACCCSSTPQRSTTESHHQFDITHLSKCWLARLPLQHGYYRETLQHLLSPSA